MTARLAGIFFLAHFALLTGCVRHATVQEFGLNGRNTQRPASSPDDSLRAIFRRQTKGAFDPLSDDPRIRTLESRINVDPTDAGSRLELGAVYESYRLYDEALEQYTHAFDANRSEKAIMGIVRCDQALKRTWQAIPLLEQFLKEVPSARLWNELGLLQAAAGNLAGGESALREAIALDHLSDQWHNNLGYNLLLQNNTVAAEQELLTALELSPNSIAAHNNLGMVLARRGEIDHAFDEFRFGADEATAHNNLAVVLLELGQYAQSRDQLVKALAIRRNFTPALSNFKLVQERIRRDAEVRKAERPAESKVRVASTEQDEHQSK